MSEMYKRLQKLMLVPLAHSRNARGRLGMGESVRYGHLLLQKTLLHTKINVYEL